MKYNAIQSNLKNQNNFSLYIHWPFCLKKCPYCDFNSYVFENVPSQWVEILIKEINIYKEIFKGHSLKSIFFGGGTPSLIPPSEISKILDAVFDAWHIDEDLEITLETNPSSVESHSFEQFLNAGITRFSIGMQSLNDDKLKFLGRLHSSQEALNILEHAAKVCKNVSADFIYTLPFDTLASWKKDLNEILETVFKFNLKHCSLYQLTIEPNTGFEQAVLSKKWVPMSEDQQSILYRYTHKVFHEIHWNFYEISNAAINESYQCQHNLTYWRYEQYLGIGPGAHSRMIWNNQKYRFNNFKNPYKWKEKVSNGEFLTLNFLEEISALSEKEQFEEKILMGFRLNEGITINSKEMQFLNKENFEILLKKDFIKVKNNKFCLSLNGKLKLNAILRMILN